MAPKGYQVLNWQSSTKSYCPYFSAQGPLSIPTVSVLFRNLITSYLEYWQQPLNVPSLQAFPHNLIPCGNHDLLKTKI